MSEAMPAQPASPIASAMPPKPIKLAEPDTEPQAIKPDNPFADQDWRISGYAWMGMLVRATIVVGGVFSAVQFMQAREEARINRSLELVEFWERPEYQDAQSAIRERLAALDAQNRDTLDANPSERERSIYAQQLGQVAMGQAVQANDTGFQRSFERVVYALNRISSCVNGNICSRDVVDEYFRDYAVSFWSYFSGYVDRQREVSPNFAKPLQAYIESGRAAP